MKSVISQFQSTSGRDPWLWPIVPRFFIFIFVAVLVLVLAWFLWLVNFKDEVESLRGQEQSLRAEFSKNYKKAVNLDALKKQREQAILYVSLLEKQLPNKAEMSALLSDINQAGVGRGLQFDLFKPGAVQVKDYYAEQPVEIEVNGTYDAIGDFVSDIAHLSRIVTIGDMDIKSADAGRLKMKAIAKTYRYLDADELNQNKKSTAPARKSAR